MGAALAIICFIYIGILGFFMMHRLDEFISSGGLAEKNSNDVAQSINADAVVYIGSNVLQPVRLFENAEGANVIFINEVNEICNKSSVRYIFAFSESDMDNLMVCSIAKKRNDGVYSGAVCNDAKNRSLFDMMDVDVLVPEQLNPEYILSIIKSDKSRRVKII